MLVRMRVFLFLLLVLAPLFARAQPSAPPPVSLLNRANTWIPAQTFTAATQFNANVTVGNGTGGPQITLNGGAGIIRQLNWRTNGQNRWQLDAFNDAESGSNTGSSLVLESFSDANVASQLFNAKRASGPLNNGRGYFTNFAPFTMATPIPVGPGGTYGTLINFGNASDTQPITPLAANPLTTTASSNVVTVNWPNCCGVNSGFNSLSGPLYNANFQTWVNLLGTTAVGGITPTGWLQVQSIIDTNNFTVNGPGNAGSSATGGGSSITVQPSFPSIAHSKFATATTGAAGFPIENQDIFVANPLFYAGGTGYERDFTMVFTPNDQSHQWQTTDQESDFGSRGADNGYQPNIYGQTQTEIGKFLVAWGNVPSFAAGGGTATNWQTAMACGSLNVTPQVGFYDCYNNGHDSLVGAAVDPTGHGGVANVVFGSYDTLNITPFATTISTSTVTVKFPGANSWLQAATNGTNVHFYAAYSLNGVTWGPGDYVITCPGNNCTGQSQFTITGTGTANATGNGGPSGQVVSFATLVPYGVTDIFGEFKHGITTTTNSKFDDGLIIHTQPGNGFGWDDGTAIASITGHEISAGNIDVVLTPVGTGTIKIGATAGVSCAANSVSLTTLVVTNGLVTHC